MKFASSLSPKPQPIVRAPEHLDELRKLYPRFREDKLREVKARLDRYIDLAMRVHLRLRSEERVAEFKRVKSGRGVRLKKRETEGSALTDSVPIPTMPIQRSNPSTETQNH